MNLLLAPTFGWGQQPITFDVVRLNPLNSFLAPKSVQAIPGGYLTFATAGDGSGDVQDLHTIRFDSQGNYLGELAFRSSRLTEFGEFANVTDCATGGFAGALSHFLGGQVIDSLFLYRFDDLGDTLWTTFLGSDTTAYARKCIEAVNGDLLVVGVFGGTYDAAYILRTNADGELISFVQPDVPRFWALGVAEAANSDLIVCGRGNSATQNNNNNANILRCTAEGEVIWRRAETRLSAFNQVIPTADGGVLAIGSYSPLLQWNPVDWNGPATAFLVKYNANGSEAWRRDIIAADNGTRECTLLDGFLDAEGDLITCGFIRNFSLGLNDKGMLHKIDPEGNVIWSRFYSHYAGLPLGNPQIFRDVEPTSDGGFILTGETWGITPPNPVRLWLVKLDSLGCLVPGCNTVGVSEFVTDLVSALSIAPNPSSTNLTYTLPLPADHRAAGSVQAVLLDAQGREVLRKTTPSNSTIQGQLDVSALHSGIYYLHLRDDQKWLAGAKVVVE